MMRDIRLKLKPFAPRARAFSVSVASMRVLRSASSSAERPERVSSKNVGDFGRAAWSFLAMFKMFSASSTKVGATLLAAAIAFGGWVLLLKSDDIVRPQRRRGASYL